MNPAKLTVFAVLFFVALGAAAWSYINLVAAPPYDPAEAQNFLRHFDVRCNAEFDDQTCLDTIGYHHRQCFEETLEEGPQGRLVGDRSAYLSCMEQRAQAILSDSNE